MPKRTAKKPASKRAPRATTHAKRSRGKAPPKPKSPPLIPIPKASRHERFSVAFKPMPGATTEVLVGSGLIPRAWEGLLEPKRAALVVVDANLPRTLVEPLLCTLDAGAIRWGISVIIATESSKSLASLAEILASAAKLRLERSDLIIALGGGIVTDLAGFAAAVYRRGVRSVLCPTTLLGMVDASIGGKTATNIEVPSESGKPRLLKNMVGAFHQPVRVVADIASLRSLQPRELRAGLAECIKHGLIGGACADQTLAAWTAKVMPEVLRLEPSVTAQLITRNIRLKARVVRDDERELSTSPAGGRMMLNLGHTFAHAIETLGGLSWRTNTSELHVGSLLHGEAVALGLLCAAHSSVQLKLTKPALLDDLRATLIAAGLPTRVYDLPPSEAIADRMMDDKKVASGSLRLILPTPGYRVKVVASPPRGVCIGAIDSIRA